MEWSSDGMQDQPAGWALQPHQAQPRLQYVHGQGRLEPLLPPHHSRPFHTLHAHTPCPSQVRAAAPEGRLRGGLTEAASLAWISAGISEGI